MNSPRPLSPSTRLAAWRAHNHLRLLSLALTLALLAPLGLYWALSRNLEPLAALFFGLIVFSLLLALWVG